MIKHISAVRESCVFPFRTIDSIYSSQMALPLHTLLNYHHISAFVKYIDDEYGSQQLLSAETCLADTAIFELQT